jgi:hypothetical protein
VCSLEGESESARSGARRLRFVSFAAEVSSAFTSESEAESKTPRSGRPRYSESDSGGGIWEISWEDDEGVGTSVTFRRYSRWTLASKVKPSARSSSH